MPSYSLSFSFFWSSSFTFCPSASRSSSILLSFENNKTRDGGARRVGGVGELAAEQVDHHLVGAHHDGSVGDLPDQVGGEATVQRPVALLPGDCQ